MTHLIKSLVNGVASDTISIRDRGFQFGDGLFETILVRDSKCLLLDHHINRLLSGTNKLGINFDSSDILEAEVQQIVRKCPEAALKIIVTRGQSDLGYVTNHSLAVTRCLLLFDYHIADREPINLGLSNFKISNNQSLAGIKHLNRLEQTLIRNSWQSDWDEAVVVDQYNRIIEGTMSNLFLIVDGTIITPKLDQCGVDGIVRQWVIDQCKVNRIELNIRRVSMDLMVKASSMFMTNSLMGVQPVGSYQGVTLEDSSIINQIQQWYQQDVENV